MDGSQNEPTMSYGHMSLTDRRDNALPTNISTPFQSTHQSLNQALGNHLPPAVGPRPTFPDSYRLSASPPIVSQNDHAGPSTHSPLQNYALPPTDDRLRGVTPGKRKSDGMNGASGKRRRDGEDGGDDNESGHGPKHWTDEEKTKLFNWLMAPGEDDHWNALRTAKNSCLRECAVEMFGSKKTYQALKGCYERSFNLFRQIYAFEGYNARIGNGPVNSPAEGERLREYERRLQNARKAGCDVGSITTRTIDHWHCIGWYNLFFQRWNGDPATTRAVVHRNSTAGASISGTGDDGDGADESLDYTDSGVPNDFQDSSNVIPFTNTTPNARDPPFTITTPPSVGGSIKAPPSGSDPTLVNLTVTNSMMNACLQLLQTQAHNSKLKLEFIRRREEREERESRQRLDMERARQEREAAEWEHTKQSAKVKQKVEVATEVLANPNVDASVKQAAGDYLKNIFLTD